MPNTGSIRILVVDDHAMVRAGLRAFLEVQQDLEVVGEASTSTEAVQEFARLRPDITLMDLRMTGRSGIDATREILAFSPEAKIIVVTTYEGDAYIRAALDAGAAAYLLKDMLSKDVIDAIRVVYGGRKVIAPRAAQSLAETEPRIHLTDREASVLDLVAKGMRNREIALLVGTTEETVKMHLKHIFAKLGATDRTEAVTLALQRGFLGLQ